ncbi:toll-like receptor 2 [Amphiura filiformis]|uniref:toll-like receptor 2 n=1 Tax=Amphiura filiformis TaxID=82378 RepID=UPI003B228E4A
MLLQWTIFSLLFILDQTRFSASTNTTEQVGGTVVPTEQSPCTYPPKGSIVCKTWNQTNVDCRGRYLICIPSIQNVASVELLDLSRNKIKFLPDNAFSGFHHLLSLLLGFNNIAHIGNHTFSGLSELRFLDLQFNFITTVSGSPFQDLPSLQTLDLEYRTGYAGDPVISLTTASFAGLKGLEELYLNTDDLNSIINVSFHQLSSLLSLDISLFFRLPDNSYSKQDFNLTGLTNLTNLKLTGGGCFDLCSLDALQNLSVGGWDFLSGIEITVSDKCLTTPLKSLTIRPWVMYNIPSVHGKLHNLRSLTLTISPDFFPLEDESIALRTLNSPLQNLTLLYDDVNPIFNATTFEPLAKLNATLHGLTLSTARYTTIDMKIEGSPFVWFPELQRLVIESDSLQGLNESTFNGLENLLELQLKFYTDYIFVSVGSSCMFKNSLKRLSMNGFNTYLRSIDILYTLNHFQYLEYVDLSHNSLDYYSESHIYDIKFPYLHTFVAVDLVWNFAICNMAPHLKQIDFSGTRISSSHFIRCSNLVVLDLSRATFLYMHFKPVFDMPLLEKLNLPMVNDRYAENFVVLHSFEVPKLRYLDMSSNQISAITMGDAKLLSNLTYLNLANNSLTSFSYMQYFVNIETLILKGNKLVTIPGTLLTESAHPNMNELDLVDNSFVCDCKINAFKTWIMTDTKVHLQNPFVESGKCNYCCVPPDADEKISVTEIDTIDLDCKSYLWLYILVGIISALFIIIAGFIVALYHWNIKNRLFLLFNRRRDPVNYLVNDDEHDDEDENGIPRYDAYVSYCNEDEDWICDELDPIIEGGEEPLRLCIRGRDIPANKPILQYISLYMKRSRKVVIILSPRYMEDRGRNKCKFELALAHQRLLEENETVLILILLEEIADNEMTLMLRQLFHRVQCLKWPGDECGQHIFWQRLREELKRRIHLDGQYEV